MGQIPVSYEESKQFLSVTNRSRYTVHAFSPCVVIAGESGSDNRLYVHPVIDRDVDFDFKGQLYLLAISGPAEIPPGGSGRVSTDLPLIVSVKPTRIAGGLEESGDAGEPYFFFNYPYNYLRPSPDGRGFEFMPSAVIPDDYPYSLGYWHWVDSLNNRFFEVAQFLDGETEAMRKVRRGESVLVYVREVADHWYRGVVARNNPTYRQASGDALEFRFGEFSLANPVPLVAEDVNLDEYRTIAEPGRSLNVVSSNVSAQLQRSMFQIPSDAVLTEQTARVAFSNYGLYEVEIQSVINPVFNESNYSRFYSGEQVSALLPQSDSDNWRWIYEDFVLLVNRHDFDTAISRCQVDTVEHRQPFEVKQMAILQHIAGDEKFPNLWPLNRDGDAMATRILAGFFGTPLYDFPHITTKFVLQIGRPENLGTYKGMAKTVLEFRVLNRTAATVSSLRSYSTVHIRRINNFVEVFDTRSPRIVKRLPGELPVAPSTDANDTALAAYFLSPEEGGFGILNFISALGI